MGEMTRRKFWKLLPTLVIAPRIIKELISPRDHVVHPITNELINRSRYLEPNDIKDMIAKMVANEEYEIHPTAIYCHPAAFGMLDEFFAQQKKENADANRFVAQLSPRRLPS